MSDSHSTQRYYLLDISRAIAALFVVLSHYSHFYAYPQTNLGSTADQPGYALLNAIYDHGGLAVPYFFALSGFVLFTLYRDRLAAGKMTGWQFFALRFSRLYPLHLATLLIVAGLQYVTRHKIGDNFIFHANDAHHFVLNLFFIQNWGLEHGYSFNGPTWSVSMEVFAYLLFFALVAWGQIGLRWTITLAAFGFFLMRHLDFPFGMIIGTFFAGGAVSFAVNALRRNRESPRQMALFATAAMIGAALSWRTALQPGFAPFADEIVWGLSMPLCVLSLATAQLALPNVGRRFAGVGNLTYASYLTHFPLQLMLAPVLIVWIGLSPNSWLFLTIYLTAVIGVSAATYQCFEIPAQSFLRRVMLHRNAIAAKWVRHHAER